MKNGLVVLNLGLLSMILSATGSNMEINPFALITGCMITTLGGVMMYRSKKRA